MRDKPDPSEESPTCEYCGGRLDHVPPGMYQCEDCGRAVSAELVE